MEIFEDRFGKLIAISERISAATEAVGNKMAERTTQVNELPRDSKGKPNLKAAKRLISMTASDMDDYTARMEAEIPIFSNSWNDGMNALIRVTTMSVDFGSATDSTDKVKEGLNGITKLLEVLSTSKQSTSRFRDTVASIPRMTSELNRSKRGVVNVLDKLISEFSNGQSLMREAEAVARSLLKE